MEAVWGRHPRVLETEMGDDLSLYDPAEERVTVLNTTASDIWRLLDGETSLRELVGLLAGAYGIESETIERDVAATVAELADQDLVERKS